MDGGDTKNFCPANIALKSEVFACGDGVFERIRIYRERGRMRGQPERLHRNSNHVIGWGSGVLLSVDEGLFLRFAGIGFGGCWG